MDKPENIAANLARNLIGLRHARSLTQDELAKAAEIPRSTVANLESGEGNPSLRVMAKVAAALGVPFDELLASPRAKVRQWHAGDIAFQTPGLGVKMRPLVPEPVPEEMLVLMDFAPSAMLHGTPHLPGTREFFTCMQGRVTIFVAGDRYELAAGDVLAFPGNVAHSYRNPDVEQSAQGISVVILAKTGV